MEDKKKDILDDKDIENEEDDFSNIDIKDVDVFEYEIAGIIILETCIRWYFRPFSRNALQSYRTSAHR